MENFSIKCDNCGKYISFEDLDKGLAQRHMITPDSEYSKEQYETLCKSCIKED